MNFHTLPPSLKIKFFFWNFNNVLNEKMVMTGLTKDHGGSRQNKKDLKTFLKIQYDFKRILKPSLYSNYSLNVMPNRF